ncbi:MAG: hypothetical protein MJZ68_00980 [archaeon]|nr:hypothetical protein [archaeon]
MAYDRDYRGDDGGYRSRGRSDRGSFRSDRRDRDERPRRDYGDRPRRDFGRGRSDDRGYGGRDRGYRSDRRDRREREMFDVVCDDCGAEFQLPFQPDEGRPVYCNDCFKNHPKEEMPRRADMVEKRPRRERSDREMFDVVCDDCGAEFQLPFQPDEGRPVYCDDCFKNHPKNEMPRRADRDSGWNNDKPVFMATCDDCGVEFDLPFEPTEGRPVYCRECFRNHSDEGRHGRGGDRPRRDFGRGRSDDRGYGGRDRGYRSDRRDDRPRRDYGDRPRGGYGRDRDERPPRRYPSNRDDRSSRPRNRY